MAPRAILNLSSADTDTLLLRVTAFCWLMAKLIGWRMFTTYRLFPAVPVFGFLNSVPLPAHIFLYGIAVMLLLVIMIIPKNKVFIFCLLIAETTSCLLDINRVQPWDYQYLFIFFVFLVNAFGDKKSLSLFALIMASTYIYGGLGKLNAGFLHTVWSKMLLQQFLDIAQQKAMHPAILNLGYSVGAFEILAGGGLLFSKTRKQEAWLLIVMHAFILVFLGPFGLKYNMVIWPWNAAMIAYLFLLFIKQNELTFTSATFFKGWNIVVTACWIVLPALNFIGFWDDYLSSAMYSGKLHEMVICVGDTSKCRPLQRFCMPDQRRFCNGGNYINLQYWSMSETKMAPYPEVRVYRQIAEKLEKQYPEASFSFIYFNEEALK